eukprot:6240753-Pyramimonas_sp.AAC.1
MCGAKPKASLTLFLAAQRDDRFDPICDATVPLVVRFTSFIWDNRVAPGRLRRAWGAVKAKLDQRTSWSRA